MTLVVSDYRDQFKFRKFNNTKIQLNNYKDEKNMNINFEILSNDLNAGILSWTRFFGDNPFNTRRYLDVDSTFFERYGR